MDILTFKAIAFVVILAMGLSGGLLPLAIGQTKSSQRIFSLSNAFAGGIFLGAGLIHMLPDARESLDAVAYLDAGLVTAVLAACGFLLVLFLERVVMTHGDDAGAIAQGASRSVLYAYALGLVLSVHSLIEGIALGTEETIGQVVVIFIAIIAHKGTSAFAFGVGLYGAQIARSRFISLMIFFACMTPIGIIIGTGLSTLLEGEISHLVVGGFDALAAGTFLYIAILDIIEEAFATPKDKGLKFVLLAVGVGIMAALALVV